MEKKIRDVPEGFEQYSDPKTGKKYLYNATTKETRWVEDKTPEWAKKDKTAETLLKKTDGGEKIFKGSGDLANPITNMDHMPKK
ncbi:unnamed protein product [Cylindrotheca closterium]|uniref:WW domain-containing protein n=1 Tax=Cylindrotheca closterium TaxID=2856 RepID=A0AAD2G1E1_9STRA|nr:unnamed protein product [Cylindrotheca closterium]